MNCEWSKENIVLYVYDELADDAKFALENHIRQCQGCRQELDSALEFKDDMAAVPVQDVSASFLAANRMQLQESLEQAAQSRNFLSSFVFDFGAWMHQLRLAPALTAVLLLVGFAGGVGTTYRMMAGKIPNSGRPPGPEPFIADASVAGVDSITRDANSNEISIKYNTLQPQTRQGTITDPYIRQLLLLAARNPGLVVDSIDLLSRRPEDKKVREALMYALRYDKNPGVRLASLDGLTGYVRDDVQVRDAVVEALMHDTNAGVRQKAIGLLDPVKADSSVHQALQVLADRDDNKFIRAESKRYLANTPHLD